jgi:hypothetical protein
LVNGEPTCFDENHNLKKLISIMLDKEAGGCSRQLAAKIRARPGCNT